MRLIVPAYFYPDPGGSDWDTLLGHRDEIGYAVVNDRSGALGLGDLVDRGGPSSTTDAAELGLGNLWAAQSFVVGGSSLSVKGVTFTAHGAHAGSVQVGLASSIDTDYSGVVWVAGPVDVTMPTGSSPQVSVTFTGAVTLTAGATYYVVWNDDPAINDYGAGALATATSTSVSGGVASIGTPQYASSDTSFLWTSGSGTYLWRLIDYTPSTADPNYTTVIEAARVAGVALLYYVDTDSAARTAAAVKADMDTWVALYGAPSGWFLDRASTDSAHLSYYSDLHTYAARRTVVLNFGAPPPSDLYGVADVAIIAETDPTGLASVSWPSWAAFAYSASYNGVLVHDVADTTALGSAWTSITSNPGVGWAFVTSSSTYASLPSYWPTERALVAPGTSTGYSADEWGWEPGVINDLPPGAFVISGGGALTGFSTGPPPDPTDDGIVLTLPETTLGASPGSLTAKVANGTPSATASFSIPGNDAPPTTAALDATGTNGGVSVLINVPSTGTYLMTVDDGTTSATASFTVLFVATSGGIVVPTLTPPAAIQNTTGVKKWVFQDPASSDYYHLPYNPNNMTSPFGPKNITYQATTAIDGNKLAWEGQEAAVQWQFEGYIRSQTEYDAFVFWRNKRNRIWVTDHYGRAWLGYITNFDAKPRRSMNVPWSHTYTMTFLIFGGPVTPV